MKKKVYLKSIKQESWSGFHRFPKCKDSVIVALGRGGYDTGLTKEQEARLEKALAMAEGNLGRFSPFWKDYVVWIGEGGLTLDLENPKDELDYCILTRSARVANGEEERDIKPKAEYLLIDTIKEAKAENVKIAIKTKAMKWYIKTTLSDKKKVLKLMGKKADNMIDEVVENTLFELIDKDAQKVLDIVNVPDFDIRLMIEDMLHLNILRNQGSKYIYAEDIIGYTLEETIDYLKDPKNQEILRVLKDKLNAQMQPVK